MVDMDRTAADKVPAGTAWHGSEGSFCGTRQSQATAAGFGCGFYELS